MELKNAAAVCLMALCSSALVVLVARSLDLQAAARLEPQLAAIVEELQALRRQGGIAAGGSAASEAAAAAGLVVYYFHSNTRCATCESIESQARGVVRSRFAAELRRGAIEWKTLNYEQPQGKPLAERFKVQVPIVVVARVNEGEVGRWNRLDEVWGLYDEPEAFARYVGDAIAAMLADTPAAAAAR